MRDYPPIQNIFRINSSSNILLDDHHHHHHHSSQQPYLLHQFQNRNNLKIEHELPYRNVHHSNGDINNYRTSNNHDNIVHHGDTVDRRSSCSFLDTITSVGNETISAGQTCLYNDDTLVNSSPIVAVNNVNGMFLPAPITKRNNYTLWIGTPVAASFAVAIVIAALAGPQWLLTEEKLPNTNYNGTANYNVLDDGVYITKYTKSSLWILCASQGLDYYCTTIDYFPNEEYSPDPNDSTMAIPYAITRATPFFLLSGIVLVVSYIILMTAMCSHQHSVYFFTSGILFIISGLLMLIGLIMYISIFKAEIGSKLRPRFPLQPPMFQYRYGQSFFLYVIGFVSTEFVGVLNVFLFISLQQMGREKTMPCFPYTRSPEKVKDMESNLMHFHGKGVPQGFNCKKHPTLPNGYFSPFTQRRYFFEKSQNCDVHMKNLAKSLNELYTEPAPAISPFDLPPEFPLTRSVSTTTDIYSNNNNHSNSNNNINHNNNCGNTKMSTLRSVHDKNDPKRCSKDSLNDICGLTKNILTNKKTKSEDELFSEFCQRAGYRPKPKDIYVIENDGRDDEKSVIVLDTYATLRKNRRASVAASEMRKTNLYNSNSSLKDINVHKSYPKSLFDLDSSDHQFLNNRFDNNYFEQNNRSDRSLYQSRTLPRDFLKRNVDFSDENLCSRRVSASGIYHPNSNDHGSHSTSCTAGDYYKKSYDTLASRNSRHRDAYSGDDSASVHWPNAIPASPSSFSTRSQFRIRSGNLCNTSRYYQRDRDESPSGRSTEDFGEFDLDKIETERRKSHASLFQVDLDFKDGTPV